MPNAVNTAKAVMDRITPVMVDAPASIERLSTINAAVEPNMVGNCDKSFCIAHFSLVVIAKFG